MRDELIEQNPRTFPQCKDLPNKKSHSATIQRASVSTLNSRLSSTDRDGDRSDFSATAKCSLLQNVSSLHEAFTGASCSVIVLPSELCGFCLVGRRVRSESLTASAFLRPSGTLSGECRGHAQRRSPERTGLDASPSPQIAVQQEFKADGCNREWPKKPPLWEAGCSLYPQYVLFFVSHAG